LWRRPRPKLGCGAKGRRIRIIISYTHYCTSCLTRLDVHLSDENLVVAKLITLFRSPE
jgi:hypothetical protein